MKWYHYVLCLFGGAFAGNFIPHFVQGITGSAFPTPFANPPPPVGMSSPVVNVLWALGNLVAAFLLLNYGRFSIRNRSAVVVAFVGFAGIAIMLANVFSAMPQ